MNLRAAYGRGWKRLEPVWGAMIRARQLRLTRPLLEGVLSTRVRRPNPAAPQAVPTTAPARAA